MAPVRTLGTRTLALVAAFVALVALPGSAAASAFESIGPYGARIDGWAQSRSHPDRMFCLPYRQGVFRSDDRGDTWVRIDPDLPSQVLRGVGISTADPDLVLVGHPATGGILRSTDAGLSWTDHPLATGWGSIRSLEFAPTQPSLVLASVYGGPHQGVWRSTDGGQTWAAASAGIAGPNPWQISWHPTQAGEALLADDAEIYRTTDGGASWSPVTETAAGIRSVDHCEADPDRVWAVDSSTGAVRSDDGGLTFVPTLASVPSGYGFSSQAVAAHPTDPDIVVVGQIAWQCVGACYTRIESFFRSTDAGASWTSASPVPQDDLRSTEEFVALSFDRFLPDRIYAAVTSERITRRGLIRSTDAGGTWRASTEGIAGVRVFDVVAGPAGRAWVRRGDAGGLWSHEGTDVDWLERGCGRNERYAEGAFEINTANGWLHEIGGMFSSDTFDPMYVRSSDQGTTWRGYWVPQSGLFVEPLALATNHGSGARVYAWFRPDGGAAELHRSDNGLDHPMWFQPPLPAFPAAAAVIDPADDTRLLAVDGDTGEVHLSTDAGVTWVPRAARLPSDAGIDLFMDPAAPGRLAVVYELAGAYRSDDGGLTWSAVPVETGGSRVVAADWDPAADRIFLATKDLGAWIPGTGLVTAGLPSRQLTSILYEPATGQVLVGTDHAGVWAMIPGDPTAAPVAESAATSLRLAAHPNPTRGDIRFAIGGTGNASPELTIHDVAGRRIAAPAVRDGTHATWDGTDEHGRRVAAGVYFARLRADEEQVTRRIVLLDR